jgi:nitronate monooxygenase
MGVGISGWQLARAVSTTGQLGVVSGICLDELMVRRLQMGDPEGHIRRALDHFPIKEMARNILDKFFKERGKGADEPFMPAGNMVGEINAERENLIVAGSFTEIFLAKEGHKGVIGVNLLEKIQTDCLSTLYGCMLAGVDYVTVGAGIPKEIPGILDSLSKNIVTKMRLAVTNAISTDDFRLTFDPSRFMQSLPLKRPKFLAIIASNVLATTLAKKSNGKVDGFIIEAPVAGGHNAPPRGAMQLNEQGEPIYGAKDEVDLEKIKELGIPFWLAGAYSLRGKVKEAIAKGAAGVQAGTPFFMCKESGLTDELRNQILASDRRVVTEPKASPTGFPFKVVQAAGTLSEDSVYKARPRVCNFGYLRERYRKDNGTMGFRCAAEPVAAYVAKGGTPELAEGCKCLCNGLIVAIGLGSVYKNGYREPAILTAGDVLSEIDYLRSDLTAKEVVDYLLE